MVSLGTQLIKANDKAFNLNDWLTKAVELGYRGFDSWSQFENQGLLGDAFKHVLNLKREVS
jgi:hypothetical protein